MLMIRLSRFGKKKQPTYRLVISEKSKDPWGDHLEILGNYNPRTNPNTVVLKRDRIEYWLSKGAQCSATVHNILVNEGVIKGEKRKVVNDAKAQKKRKEEKQKKHEEAAAAKTPDAKGEAEPAADAEAPATEEKAEKPPATEAPTEKKPAEEATPNPAKQEATPAENTEETKNAEAPEEKPAE
jgi:small subunit ribosomal protein S16